MSDPNAALAVIRTLVSGFNERASYEDMDQLVEVVNGLDEWLSKGGFLPTAWGARVTPDDPHVLSVRHCLRCKKDLTDVMGVSVFVRTGINFRRVDGLLCLEHGANGENGLSASEYERLTGKEEVL